MNIDSSLFLVQCLSCSRIKAEITTASLISSASGSMMMCGNAALEDPSEGVCTCRFPSKDAIRFWFDSARSYGECCIQQLRSILAYILETYRERPIVVLHPSVLLPFLFECRTKSKQEGNSASAHFGENRRNVRQSSHLHNHPMAQVHTLSPSKCDRIRYNRVVLEHCEGFTALIPRPMKNHFPVMRNPLHFIELISSSSIRHKDVRFGFEDVEDGGSLFFKGA
ncbi:uncharacterized protein C8R40DRAFT_1084576 [Lentinula edodes]|uniref:uncharacterized protein n=1 Tax=Lentinula edodes TaxID=5353 RepID=UPI001E8D85FE|nr:uncharacterized protein C8R40DRAFT_1084576 [Lentinula edodes]KAH7880112.1 hypothetical protein C8R40DRAFT_1084576 [Lentinula edodes]